MSHLRYFFEQIVHERYGYQIVFDRESNYLEDKEINYIYLGDTRHLSMINIVLESDAPTAAMVLAGQDDLAVSANYFGNIDKYVECKVYRQYRKMISGKTHYAISKDVLSGLQTGQFREVNGGTGRCYSPKVAKHDYSDCAKVAGPDGEIGYCEGCTYYRTGSKAFYGEKDKYIDEIRVETTALKAIIEKIRKENGSDEEMSQAILKLQAAEYSYQQYLKETIRNKETEDGKEENHNK